LEGPPGSIGDDLVMVGGPAELTVKDDTKVFVDGDCVYALVSNGTVRISVFEDEVQRSYITVRAEKIHEGKFG